MTKMFRLIIFSARRSCFADGGASEYPNNPEMSPLVEQMELGLKLIGTQAKIIAGIMTS